MYFAFLILPRILTPLYSHCYTPTGSALKGQLSGSTDIFYEQGQQNTCHDVNVRSKRKALQDTWQLSNLK